MRRGCARSNGRCSQTDGQPLPMCTTSVDACYESREGELGCVNPEFHELPVGAPTFKIFAQIRTA